MLMLNGMIGPPVAMPALEEPGGPIQDISGAPEPDLPEAADDESWLDEPREL